MKELLRLRHLAPRVRLVAGLALLAILLTSLLRSVAIWQVKSVTGAAFKLAGQESTPEAEHEPGAVESMFPRATASIKNTADAVDQWWNGLFGIDPSLDDQARWRRMLLAACVALCVFGLGSTLTEMVSIYVLHYLGDRVLMGLRQRLFEHLNSLPLKFFEEKRTGDLLSRLGNDTAVLQGIFGSHLAGTLTVPPTCVGALIIMLILSWRLSLAVCIMLPVAALIAAWVGGKVKRYSRQVQERIADLVALLEQTLSGIRVVQAFGLEERINGLFMRGNVETFRTAMRVARMRAINTPVAAAVLIVGTAGALFVGGNEIISGRLSPNGLVTFIMAMQMLGAGVGRLTRMNMTIQQAAASAVRIYEIIDTESDLVDAPDATALEDIAGRVTFTGVDFTYGDPLDPVLRGIDLDIKPGEVVAVAGPSGAGKTTLANLVPRLYDVTGGQVLVDGQDVRGVTRASLRRFMGIVPQETVLFGTSVAENISYGKPGSTHEELIEAAKAAHAHEFIEALPEGYETQIGERGAKLSGGQRQRLAIARALLRDPRILILDEATSSLDAESESLVQAAIGRLLEGRTALIIAHRLSTIRDADRIVVMAQGRIAEVGTHAELMAAGGLYQALYETQAQEDPAPEVETPPTGTP